MEEFPVEGALILLSQKVIFLYQCHTNTHSFCIYHYTNVVKRSSIFYLFLRHGVLLLLNGSYFPFIFSKHVIWNCIEVTLTRTVCGKQRTSKAKNNLTYDVTVHCKKKLKKSTEAKLSSLTGAMKIHEVLIGSDLSVKKKHLPTDPFFKASSSSSSSCIHIISGPSSSYQNIISSLVYYYIHQDDKRKAISGKKDEKEKTCQCDITPLKSHLLIYFDSFQCKVAILVFDPWVVLSLTT